MYAEVGSLLAVILIDLALSADNAVGIGIAAAALPAQQRQRAVFWGVIIALVFRIIFGLVTVELLHIRGILLVGGLLLLWIAIRMWRDLAAHAKAQEQEVSETPPDKPARKVTFTRAIISIVGANLALSLDNVLAVAGVARNNPAIMTFGIVLAVLLMGVAASLIARIVDKNRWIGQIGVAVIVFAGGMMIWDDLSAFYPGTVMAPPEWLGGHAVLPP